MEKKPQVRAKFTYRGHEYNLVVTDDTWGKNFSIPSGPYWNFDNYPFNGSFHLVVGIGEDYKGRHYKLVVAVITNVNNKLLSDFKRDSQSDPERAINEPGLFLADSLGKKEYTCQILNAKFVLIPAGMFMMGSPEDEPWRAGNETLRQVTISKPFYLQTTPVTQGQWEKVMGENPLWVTGDDNFPVEKVSWNDVQKFIRKINEMEGTEKYRLPTEAEWEYACRAGSTTAYCFGDDPGRLNEYAWYADNSGDKTHPVGRKKPNDWGLYDMHGNVGEWVQDRYDDDDWDYPPSGLVTDPPGPSSGSSRALRGGSGHSYAGVCRSANRDITFPDRRVDYLGFRLLRTR
ncbi:MAG: formylglycine-generating enzyme family protein [Deltaproteobacteria bacterium]|nr:formylglycine-generating enzyme family protein [Deltaproteobacteria bacterium]